MPGRFSNLELRERQQEQDGELSLQQAGRYDADDYLHRATEAYRVNDFEKALRFYTRCLERDRTIIPAWVGQVQMLVQLGECHEARLWSDKALELFRENGELLAAKAQACARLNDRRASFACSDGALQAPGSSPWRWQVRGEVLLAAGEPNADTCFQKSLAEPAADWWDRIVIGRIYLFYGRATNALMYIRSALEAESAAAVAWYERGRCEAALAMTGAAHASYTRCLELCPEFAAAAEAIGGLQSMSFVEWLTTFLFRRKRR